MKNETKPVKREYTKDQLLAIAIIWTKANYGEFKDKDPDKFFERMGMIVDFTASLIDE